MKLNTNKIIQKAFFILLNDKKDYRLLPFGLVFIYISILFFSEFYLGSYEVMGNYFKIYPVPYFIDLKVLLCGIDAIRISSDPYSSTCFYGVGSLFNYPIMWGFLSFIPFITMSNLIYIGFGIGLTLFVLLYIFIGKINLFGSIIYMLFFISPAIMLGVERGNSDLIIFILLLIFHLLQKKYNILLSLIILIVSTLKLFPIGAVFCILNNQCLRLKKALLIFVTVLVIFLVYLMAMKDNILLVSKKTPRPFGDIAFGLGGLPSLLIDYFKRKEYFYFLIEINKKNPNLIFYTFLLLLITVFIIIYLVLYKYFKIPLVKSNHEGNSYLIGSGIFIVTCLIGYNFQYRLIFLIFTLPQLLFWIREFKFFAFGLLFISILIVWQSFINMNTVINIFFMQFFIIFLFYSHLFILVNFLNNFYIQFYQLVNKKN